MSAASDLRFASELDEATRQLFDDQTCTLIAALIDEFAKRRHVLLGARVSRRRALSAGTTPELVRRQDVEAAGTAIPQYLLGRRIELQTRASAESLLQAFQSETSTVVLDLGNTLAGPTAALAAQHLVRDVLHSSGVAQRPVFIFGPRGLEQDESRIHWHDEAVPAALLDVLLFLLQNGAQLENAGHGPCLHLAGVDAPEEAQFWADVLRWLEDAIDLPAHTIKTSIGIDTVHANFCVHEIIGALRGAVTAVTTNHYAYLRSFIHTFPHQPQFVLPDRAELTPATHFLRAQGVHLLRNAHQHDIHALAECNAPLPPETGEGSRTLQWLRGEIERAARDGFDGCSIADPRLVDIAKESFDRLMPGQHQLHRLRDETHITGADLLQVAKGKITEDGLRENIRLAVLGWVASTDAGNANELRGAESSIASIELAADQLWQWQWLDTGILDDGRIIDHALLQDVVQDETTRLNVPPEALQAAVARLERHLQQRELAAHFLAP